ncbi:GNAT family N-acetyltransferase [Aquitalea pelogenes]|nr:GNAT family N-acetyltransferase [Aquitalea pelogenes]
MIDFAFAPASAADFDALLALRLRALRVSLEALGRYDPVRARQRFADHFQPEYCRHIVVNGQRVGCVSLKPAEDGLLIDQFYLQPAWHGRGLGSQVLQALLAEADEQGLPVQVEVLKGSRANGFYQRQGFVLQADGQYDNYYQRPACVAA